MHKCFFFNSICQILYSMPDFLARIKYTLSTNNVVTSMQDILERMKICDFVYPNTYIRRIALNDYVFGTQQDAQEALGYILDKIYPENRISPFCVTLNETIYCRDLLCRQSIDENHINKKESHQILPIEVVEIEQQSVQGLLNVKLETHEHLDDDYPCEGCTNRGTSSKATRIDEANDIVVIQLKLFSYDVQDGSLNKKFPSIIN